MLERRSESALASAEMRLSAKRIRDFLKTAICALMSAEPERIDA